jgi:hypothetical protein
MFSSCGEVAMDAERIEKDTQIARDDIARKIRSNSRVDPATGCWVWTMSIASQGYGKLTIKRKMHQAHRLSWLAFRGPPGDLLVCHRCDNPACVNPDHLFLGTPADNTADMMAKGRHAKGQPGETSPTASLTNAQAAAIRRMSERTSDIARKFNVSEATIWRIRTGLTYKQAGTPHE